MLYVLTPNEPADFENPFHLHLFDRVELRDMLERHFGDVWLGGVDVAPHVKDDFAARRVKANKLLRLDVLDLRHRMPHSWYVWAYTRLLPLAYKLVARGDAGGVTGITADDWFVTEQLDDTTLVLFAVARRPRAGGRPPDARRRPHRRHRVGQVRRGRPARGPGAGSSTPTRWPATWWRRRAGLPAPVDRFGPGSSPPTGPSTGPRWRRSPSPTRRPGWRSTPSPTRPSASP